MTINERIKYLRKDVLKMNQTDFAEAIGMKQRGASYIEQSGAGVTDKTIKTICLVFNLNEDWLRNGTEPMYIQAPTFSLDDFVKKHSTNDTEYQLLLGLMKTYFEIDADVRRALVQHFKSQLDNRSTSAEEMTTADAEDVYKKSRLRAVQKEKLSASNITADANNETDNKQKNIV